MAKTVVMERKPLSLSERSYLPQIISGLKTTFSNMFKKKGVWELPNSFVKRQCDIAPGAPAHHPVAQRICFLVDQADSVVGGLLAVSLAVPVPRATWLCLTFGGAATHLAFNYGLMRMGLRERAA